MTAPHRPWIRFRATIRINGINPYVQVGPARARAMQPGWRKPMPVLVRVNGHPKPAPWRINLMPMGNGAFYLYLHGTVRKAADTGVGDRVEIALRFDTAYWGGPEPSMPAWFRTALGHHRAAQAAWLKLAPSRQKEMARYLGNLKSVDARARNLARALSALTGSTHKFLGRTP